MLFKWGWETVENKRKKVKKEPDPSSGPAWLCQLRSCSSPWWCRQDSWHGCPEWWHGILLQPPAVLVHNENVKKKNQRIEEKKGQAVRCIDVLAPLQDGLADGPLVQLSPCQGFSSAPKQTNRILFKTKPWPSASPWVLIVPCFSHQNGGLPMSDSRNEQNHDLSHYEKTRCTNFNPPKNVEKNVDFSPLADILSSRSCFFPHHWSLCFYCGEVNTHLLSFTSLILPSLILP